MNAWARGWPDADDADEHAAAVLGQAVPLVTAKLTMPARPFGVLARPHLNARLDAAAAAMVTLITAPAGFGKTAAVTQWLAATPARAVAWLSLDDQDNDPARFWAYALAALEGAGARCQPWAGRVIQAVGKHPPAQALAPLANTLAGLADEMIMVLDDCHLISDQRIHRALEFLIDCQPPRFRLVILARSDPPFVTARQQASGQVIRFGAQDLAFSEEEMTCFLASQRISLPAGLAGPLCARLGGWPAALRLLTLWLPGQDDPAAALAAFTVSDATLANYLTTEILGQMPARLHQFLLRTSILPRLTGPLCEAVTGQPGGATTLARLHRSGMFTDPDSGQPGWFRYHDLFRELLQLELRRTHFQVIPRLHRRASAWLAAHGFSSEAITHSLAAGDWPAARALICAEGLAAGSHYHPATVEGWCSLLPPSVLRADQVWLTLHAFGLLNLGRPGDASRALTRAATLASQDGPEPGPPGLGAIRHALAAGVARLDCDLAAAQRCLEATRRELAPAGRGGGGAAAMARVAAANAAAATLFWHGDLPAARQLLRRTEAATASHRLVRARVSCLSLTALLHAISGQLGQAGTLTAGTLDLARDAGLSGGFQATPALLASAVTALYRDDHAWASQQAAEVADRARLHADRAPFLAACILLARLTALGGDLPAAFALLSEPSIAFPGWPPPPALHALTAEHQARLHLLSGDTAAARATVRELHALPQDNPLTSLATQTTQARILRAEDDNAGSAALFSAVARAARRHGLLPRAIEALTEAAAASHAADPLTAAACLGQALTLARGEMITAPFTGEAAAIRPLLLHMEQSPQEHSDQRFRQHLLTLMGVPAAPLAPPAVAAPSSILSDRERTVLRLLHGTLSNAEIAATLNISPNTLKTHIRHLYRKLGTTTRDQAITRARELGLAKSAATEMAASNAETATR